MHRRIANSLGEFLSMYTPNDVVQKIAITDAKLAVRGDYGAIFAATGRMLCGLEYHNESERESERGDASSRYDCLYTEGIPFAAIESISFESELLSRFSGRIVLSSREFKWRDAYWTNVCREAIPMIPLCTALDPVLLDTTNLTGVKQKDSWSS